MVKKKASWLEKISFVCVVAGFGWYPFNPKWILLAIVGVITLKISLRDID